MGISRASPARFKSVLNLPIFSPFWDALIIFAQLRAAASFGGSDPDTIEKHRERTGIVGLVLLAINTIAFPSLHWKKIYIPFYECHYTFFLILLTAQFPSKANWAGFWLSLLRTQTGTFRTLFWSRQECPTATQGSLPTKEMEGQTEEGLQKVRHLPCWIPGISYGPLEHWQE